MVQFRGVSHQMLDSVVPAHEVWGNIPFDRLHGDCRDDPRVVGEMLHKTDGLGVSARRLALVSFIGEAING